MLKTDFMQGYTLLSFITFFIALLTNLSDFALLVILGSLFFTGYIYKIYFEEVFSKDAPVKTSIIVFCVFILMIYSGITAYFLSISSDLRNNFTDLLPTVEVISSFIKNPFKFTAEMVDSRIYFMLFLLFIFFQFSKKGKDIINKLKETEIYQAIYHLSKILQKVITVMFALMCYYDISLASLFLQYLILFFALGAIKK